MFYPNLEQLVNEGTDFHTFKQFKNLEHVNRYNCNEGIKIEYANQVENGDKELIFTIMTKINYDFHSYSLLDSFLSQ